MAKISEPVIKTVMANKPKWLTGLDQKVRRQELDLTVLARDHHAARSTAGAYPPQWLQKRNVETPYPAHICGQASRKVSPWVCGFGMSEEANAVL